MHLPMNSTLYNELYERARNQASTRTRALVTLRPSNVMYPTRPLDFSSIIVDSVYRKGMVKAIKNNSNCTRARTISNTRHV